MTQPARCEECDRLATLAEPTDAALRAAGLVLAEAIREAEQANHDLTARQLCRAADLLAQVRRLVAAALRGET